MKAATQHKHCKSSRGVRASYASAHRLDGAHVPKRHLTHASDVRDAGGPHLTVTWNDAPTRGDAGVLDTDLTIPRILLVDRDPETAAALTTLMMPEAKLVHAASIAEARRLLDSQLFSMLIIDPSLPDGNGAMVINAVEHTPILVYSATEPTRFDKVPFLSKPDTTARELWNTISQMLGIGSLPAAED